MILADTGFWVALGNRADRWHALALDAAQRHTNETLVTTWPVLTEVTHLLLARLGPHALGAFMEGVAHGACRLIEPPDDALQRATGMIERYRNLPMDLADASLVILAEQLNEGRILSTDQRDFAGYRWKHTRPFVNLLIPN